MNKIMNNNIINNGENNIKKLAIRFTTTLGTHRNIIMNFGETIGQALIKYLIEANKPDLINRNDKVSFLFNATKINFDDETKIEDYFKNVHDPKILVNDTEGLRGG